MDEANQPRGYNSRTVKRLMGGCSTATLYRRLADPKLGMPKPKKIGGTNLWNAIDFDRWLAVRLAA